MTERVLVVTPTYQEAGNIPQLLRSLHENNPGIEVLVVDDGSPDGTADLAAATGTDLGLTVHVMRRQAKQGLGAAYRAGFAWALARDYSVLVQMDADLSHDPAQLPSLLDGLGEDVDLVIGSRYVPGGRIPDWPLHRRALSRFGNAYARFALQLPLHDTTTGYRAWRAQMAKAVDVASITAEGYGFLIEAAHRAARLDARIVEVPISFSDRTLGKSKMSGAIIVEAMTMVARMGLADAREAVRTRVARRR